MEPLPVAGREQAREVLEVLLAAYREEAHLLAVESFPPLRRTTEGVQHAESLFFGLHTGGRLAAVAEVESLGPGRRGISSLVVHPAFFRRGFGSRLVEGLLARFPADDFEVSTGAANQPAVRLYEKYGFHRVRRWRREEGIDMVELELTREGPSAVPAAERKAR